MATCKHCYLIILLFVFGPSAGSSTQPPIQFSVYEKRPVGTFVGDVRQASGLTAASSASSGVSPVPLHFTIRNGSQTTDYFTIDESTGVIRTSRIIDRDTGVCAYQPSCVKNLDVQVTPDSVFQVFKVQIDVLDINDHTPTFTPASVTLSISESTVPNTLFGLPSADDPDGGNDGIQSFRLMPANNTKFALKNTSLADGSITIQLQLMDRLDRSKASSYLLTVLAIDGGTPPLTGTLTVNINVTNINSDKLQFTNATYDVIVPENQPLGTTIITVVAGYSQTPHASTLERVVYGFTANLNNPCEKNFGINNQTGVIQLTGGLNYEDFQTCLLNVWALDTSQPSTIPTSAIVVVHVTDVNDNAPSVTVTPPSGQVTMKDNVLAGSFVAYLSITDPDGGANGQVSCSMPNSSLFQLGPISGDYKLTTSATYRANVVATSYVIVVRCSDAGTPPLSSTVQVTVMVQSTGPSFPDNQIQVNFRENNQIGDVITTLKAADSDLKARLTYGINVTTGETPVVSVDPSTGVVSAAVVLSFDRGQQYVYQMTAVDSALPSVTATVTFMLNVLKSSNPQASSSMVPPVTAQNSQATTDPKDTSNGWIIITGVVCGTVIVVAIIVVFAVVIVRCRIASGKKERMQAGVSMTDVNSNIARSISFSSSERSDKELVKREASTASSMALSTVPEESYIIPAHLTDDMRTDIGLPPKIPRMTSHGGPKRPSLVRNNRLRGGATKSRRASDDVREDGSDMSRGTDVDSESGTSGSFTDSGRGQSLQGDYTNLGFVHGLQGYQEGRTHNNHPPILRSISSQMDQRSGHLANGRVNTANGQLGRFNSINSADQIRTKLDQTIRSRSPTFNTSVDDVRMFDRTNNDPRLARSENKNQFVDRSSGATGGRGVAAASASAQYSSYPILNPNLYPPNPTRPSRLGSTPSVDSHAGLLDGMYNPCNYGFPDSSISAHRAVAIPANLVGASSEQNGKQNEDSYDGSDTYRTKCDTFV